jgi:hypothetical protein
MKISWLDAAEIVGGCDRTMRRMREEYQTIRLHGADGPAERQAEFAPGADGHGERDSTAVPGKYIST